MIELVQLLHKRSQDDHIIGMLRALPVLFVLTLAACSAPTRWEKTGSDVKATADDLSACRHAARNDALAAQPGPRTFALRDWVYYDSGRTYSESRLTGSCMKHKGYRPVTTASTPAQAPLAAAESD